MHTSSGKKKINRSIPEDSNAKWNCWLKKIPRFSTVAIKLNSLNQMLLQVVKIFLHLKSSIGVLRVFMPAPSTWCPLTAFFFQDGSRSDQGMPSSIAMLKRSWAQGCDQRELYDNGCVTINNINEPQYPSLHSLL